MAKNGVGGDKLHELHLADCLATLNTVVDPNGKIEKLKPKSDSLQKTYARAESAERVEKDEEMAYVCYMRFITMAIKADEKIKKEFSTRLGTAMRKCEELSDRLKKRYETAQECIAAEERVKKWELNDAAEYTKKKEDLPNGVISPVDEHGITAVELKTLIDKRSTRFLLIDTRSPADFKSSHPKHPDSISISNVILAKGISANSLGPALKYSNPDSYEIWNKRESFDLIVLYDWNSSFEPRESTIPISVLYDAMTQWDPNTKYRGSIKILQGGFRNFCHKYPSYLTNPCSSNGLSNEGGKVSVPSLDAIKYPSLDYQNPTPTSEENNNPNQSSKTIKTNNPTINRTNKPTHLIPQDPPPQAKPNNVPPPMTNGMSNGEKGEKSLEEHGKEVAAVLDDLINVSKKTQAAEADLHRYQENQGHASTPSEELNEKLKEKEKIIEEMTQQLQQKTIHFDELKARYELSLERERAKRTFPSVRPTKIETEIATKEKLKEELAEHVKKIREERKRKEAAGLFNGLVLNGHHPDTGPNQPRPGALKGSLSATRPSSEDVTPHAKTYTEKLRPEGEQQRNNVGLKRSHSNPNLTQLSFVEEPPIYNRSQKPQSRRDFSTVSSTQRTQRTGLKNVGNTCYMNSIVQCLSHTRDLAAILTSEGLRLVASPGGKTRGEVTKELGWTIQQLHLGYRCIAPDDLKRIIGKYHNPFSGNQQQDSHELLTFLLDWMHEELNKSSVKKLKEQNNDNIPDEVASVTFWKDFLSLNDSPISRLFAGEQKSCLKCLSCQKESVTFGAFYFLSVPLPTTGSKNTLTSCLDLYMQPEVLPDLKCVHCKVTGKTIKKFDLWRLPKYLIIHLQRFHNNGDGNCRKRINEVDCPLASLDMSTWVKGSTITRANYNLFAISNHYGSMEGGHYTAFCRNTDSWTKFDDADVTLISAREVCTTAAYILFYQLQDD